MPKMTLVEKYEAMANKDTASEGALIIAVKTTGIFCRPTCRARKPLPENVVFFDTTLEALQHGFRPCKVCRPMEIPGETPDYIRDIILELHHDPHQRLKDYDLIQRGIKPGLIRQWFKKHHKLTFHAYQRMVRLNAAYKSIEKGGRVSSSATLGQTEPLSGIHNRHRSIFGQPPTGSHDQGVIQVVRFPTPIGAMYACATEVGLCLLEFTDRRMLETEFKDLCRRLKAVIRPGENPYLSQVQAEIKEYFDGKRKSFGVPLHTPGTKFQNRVWKILQEIPYGGTRSYKEQAVAAGNPQAIRAVASANGQNRISIIIPCHRVIGSDGSLVGYGGGLHRKRWLLDFEKANAQ